VADGAEGAAGPAAENPLPVRRDERGRERRAYGGAHADPFQKSGRLHSKYLPWQKIKGRADGPKSYGLLHIVVRHNM
jgi:hypothetical protein